MIPFPGTAGSAVAVAMRGEARERGKGGLRDPVSLLVSNCT